MFVGALTLLAFAFIPVVLAQGDLSGLLQALNASGLDQFASAVASLNSTPIGQSVLAQLSKGNNTIFTPTDSALSSAHITDLNETALADAISYHIVPGNFVNRTETYPNVTIGRTLLNASNIVMLEGNLSQVLVWSKYDNGTLFAENNGSNFTVLNSTSYNDTAVLTIDSVLTPPPNMSTVLSDPSHDLSAVNTLLQSTYLVNGPSLLDILSSSRGITIFAPSNTAVQAAGSSLSGISNNATALQNILSNHVINGSTVYTTELSNHSTFTTAGGQNLTSFFNSTGLYIAVGGTLPVQIVEADLLTSNGVIQVVNGVILDTNSNPALASSAYASATSVAAQSATQTGPVVSTPTPTETHAGAAKDGIDNWKLGMLATMFALGLGQII